MCGFAGFFCCKWPTDGAQVRLNAMTDTIANRGPDSEGHWLDADAGIALGHRRLAIVDLSPAGHQPMLSAFSKKGRYSINISLTFSMVVLFLWVIMKVIVTIYLLITIQYCLI